MGRSSVYNRLKLDGVRYLEPIGYTRGWGHFHISDGLFLELRDYLRSIGHEYADRHRFRPGTELASTIYEGRTHSARIQRRTAPARYPAAGLHLVPRIQCSEDLCALGRADPTSHPFSRYSRSEILRLSGGYYPGPSGVPTTASGAGPMF